MTPVPDARDRRRFHEAAARGLRALDARAPIQRRATGRRDLFRGAPPPEATPEGDVAP